MASEAEQLELEFGFMTPLQEAQIAYLVALEKGQPAEVRRLQWRAWHAVTKRGEQWQRAPLITEGFASISTDLRPVAGDDIVFDDYGLCFVESSAAKPGDLSVVVHDRENDQYTLETYKAQQMEDCTRLGFCGAPEQMTQQIGHLSIQPVADYL